MIATAMATPGRLSRASSELPGETRTRAASTRPSDFVSGGIPNSTNRITVWPD
jgi:hypothetical protein